MADCVPGSMATPPDGTDRTIRAILTALGAPPSAIGVLILGWVVIWLVFVVAHPPLGAAIAASACWLSGVLTVLAWADLLRMRSRWGSGEYHSLRMPLHHYRWWLAPAALLVGIAFGYKAW